MAQDSKPPSGNTMGDVIGNQGIVTQGQIGDNYVLQFVPPSVNIVGQLPPRNVGDGTYELQVVFRLDSQAQANSLAVAIVKADVVAIAMRPAPFIQPNNGGGMMNVQTGENEVYIWTKVQTPAKGEWVIKARVATQDAKPRIQILLD